MQQKAVGAFLAEREAKIKKYINIFGDTIKERVEKEILIANAPQKLKRVSKKIENIKRLSVLMKKETLNHHVNMEDVTEEW